jgi:hypothetical protein
MIDGSRQLVFSYAALAKGQGKTFNAELQTFKTPSSVTAQNDFSWQQRLALEVPGEQTRNNQRGKE